MSRREEIEAAITAYNTVDQVLALPSRTCSLLLEMFPSDSVCERSLASLEVEGFDRSTATRLLRRLIEAGFLTKERGRRGAIGSYRLHLPPQVRP